MVRLMLDSEREILAPAEVTEAHLVNTVSARPRPDLGSGVEADSGAGAGLRSKVPADLGLMFPATHSSLHCDHGHQLRGANAS